MKPAPVDLPIIWRNCDWAPVILRWKDTNGVEIDLSNWIPSANTKDFDLNAVRTTPYTGGVTQMQLSKVQTAVLKLGVYQWNWIFSNTDGTVLPPLLAGNVEVRNPVQLTP